MAIVTIAIVIVAIVTVAIFTVAIVTISIISASDMYIVQVHVSTEQGRCSNKLQSPTRGADCHSH